MSAAAPGTNGWSIGINVPENKEEILQKKLLLQNKSVATSGDVYQYMKKNGKKYSHITDPRTGYGVSFQRNVTVIANDGATADWLATACSILPLKKAKKLVRKMNAELLIAKIKRGKINFYATKGFADYWK
jgi:thiamine biosynthesis lipoprotein